MGSLRETVERAARLEAGHVAELIADEEFQGFYFSKAVTAGRFAELIEARTSMVPKAA